MADTVKLTIDQRFATLETFGTTTSPASGSSGNTRRYDSYDDTNVTLSSTTTPATWSPVFDLSATLSGTTKDFDFTAAPKASDVNTNGNATGKKLIALKIKADSGNNSGGLIVKPHATNGYFLFGTTSDRITIYPGQSLQIYQFGVAASLPAVGASAKVIQYDGTIGDVIECLAIFG